MVLKLDEKQKKEPFSIFKITGDEIKETKIKLEDDLFLKSIKIKLNFNGNGVMICGVYSNSICSGGVEGIYSIRDFSKDEMNITTAKFTDQITKRTKQQQGFYSTKSIAYFSDGTMCVLTEVETFKMDYYRGTKTDNLDFDKVYLCTNDLVLTIISADNKIINTVQIKKKFFGNRLLPDYLSYKAEIVNDRIYIVYNTFKELGENPQSSKGLQAAVPSREIITNLVIVDKTGKIESTKPITQTLDSQKNKLILLPGFSCVKENTFLFNSYNIGENRFGFLEVE